MYPTHSIHRNIYFHLSNNLILVLEPSWRAKKMTYKPNTATKLPFFGLILSCICRPHFTDTYNLKLILPNLVGYGSQEKNQLSQITSNKLLPFIFCKFDNIVYPFRLLLCGCFKIIFAMFSLRNLPHVTCFISLKNVPVKFYDDTWLQCLLRNL